MTRPIDTSAFEHTLDSLRRGWERYCTLQKAVEATLDAESLTLARDGVCKRYELSIEQAWKLMQRRLESEDDRKIAEEARLGSRSTLRLAQARNWIADFDAWVEFVGARNLLTHIYDEPRAVEVVMVIIPRFIAAAEQFLQSWRAP